MKLKSQISTVLIAWEFASIFQTEICQGDNYITLNKGSKALHACLGGGEGRDERGDSVHVWGREVFCSTAGADPFLFLTPKIADRPSLPRGSVESQPDSAEPSPCALTTCLPFSPPEQKVWFQSCIDALVQTLLGCRRGKCPQLLPAIPQVSQRSSLREHFLICSRQNHPS